MAVLPQSSVAVQVLVTVKLPGQLPGVVISEKVMTTEGSHASVAVGGINVGVTVQAIGVTCVAQVIVGGVLSSTTIDLLQVAVFPQSSVAVHVLVAVYVPGQDPGVDESVNETDTV